MDHQGRLNEQWEFTQRDVQILHCLALALIHMNMDGMERRGIGTLLSMTKVPESDMTEELKALRERLKS